MKILIIAIAILLTVGGAFTSYMNREFFIQAALISEGLELVVDVQKGVEVFYSDNGVMPHSNDQASLPPPHVIYGSTVEHVAVRRDGIIEVSFNDQLGAGRLNFSPEIDPMRGLIGWNCSSDSIKREILERLESECTYIPETTESRLMASISKQDTSEVRTLLAEPLDIEMPISGNTPMMLAARIGNLDIMRLLIDAGASIDHALANSQRRTPLMVAISSNRSDVVALLLSEGASLDRKDYSGKSAMDTARETDQRLGGERYELMLAARFNPLFAGHKEDEYAPSAAEKREALAATYRQFEFATATCHVMRLESLLKSFNDYDVTETINGAPLVDVTVKPACTTELSHYLKTKSSWQDAFVASFELVIDRCELETADSMLRENPEFDLAGSSAEESLFFRAMRSGCTDVLNLFLRDSRMSEYLNADMLVRAIKEVPQSAVLRTVSILIQSGAEISNASEDGQTPLWTAIAFEHPIAARYLVDAGADANVQSSNDSWPLIEAARKGYYHLALQMIKNGALVNVGDDRGRTALHAAVGRGATRLVQALVIAGANPRQRDANGLDAITMALTTKHKPIQALLVSQAMQ